jgi:hypothetical protein
MTDAATKTDESRGRLASVLFSPVVLWTAFYLVQAWLCYLSLSNVERGFGDVRNVYPAWVLSALRDGTWVGISVPWVYPIIALVPMLGAAAFGMSHYGEAWLAIVVILNTAGFATLVGRGRSRVSVRIGWWWVAFLFLVGPIALSRIDSVTIPLAIMGVVLLGRRPVVASVLLSIATWIKIWPFALLAAIIIASKDRIKVVAAAAGTSVAIIAIALALGSGANVLSFITQQTGRGLQIEAPVGAIWLWEAAFHTHNAAVYYDSTILTFQVRGDGAAQTAAFMNPLLGLAVLSVCLLGIFALTRGTRATDLLGPLSLGLVTAIIAFNKVGSPQYINWLAVPVILGLAYSALYDGPSFRVPAALVLVIATLTQLIYPTFYDQILLLDPIMLVVLSARNILLFVLLGWTVWSISGLPKRDATADRVKDYSGPGISV